MDHCDGTLVIHSDGTTAACSEELAGRWCAGPGAEHRSSSSCEVLLGDGGCEWCTVELWHDRDWRHAAHVGRMARGRRRCRRSSGATVARPATGVAHSASD